jgi:pilus assembly protein Flp/PilA
LPLPCGGEQAHARKAGPMGESRGEGVRHVLTFIREDEGQGLVEYALIIAVIAIAVIVAMVFLRGQIQNIFSNIGNNLT